MELKSCIPREMVDDIDKDYDDGNKDDDDDSNNDDSNDDGDDDDDDKNGEDINLLDMWDLEVCEDIWAVAAADHIVAWGVAPDDDVDYCYYD